MLSGEKHPDFSVLCLLFEPVDFAGKFCAYVLPLACKLRESIQVICLPFQL
jgi:hypothetical protein